MERVGTREGGRERSSGRRLARGTGQPGTPTWRGPRGPGCSPHASRRLRSREPPPQLRPAPRAGSASAAAFPERRGCARVPVRRETEGHRSSRLPEPRSADTPGMPAPQRTPARSPCVFPGPVWSMLPAAMKGLSLVLLAALLCSAPAHGLWCQDCTLTTNSSHCTPKQCQPSDTVCASVRITDPSSSRKDHSVNRMCASSCEFVKRHFFSDYLMGFINSGILKVDVDCCEKDLCNGVSETRGSPWALAGGLLLSLGPTLLRAGP